MKKLCLILPLALILCFMVGCQDKKAMAELEEMKTQVKVEEQNKEIAHRFFEEVWNQGKLDVIEEIFDADFVGHPPDGPDIHGPEGLKQFVTMYRTAIPDIQFKVEDQIAEEDKVAFRWTNTWTHKGELMGIPPTGVQGTSTGISFFRIAGGKIVERWLNWDNLGMMQQLGMKLKPKEAEK